jgi:hypothetical protein
LPACSHAASAPQSQAGPQPQSLAPHAVVLAQRHGEQRQFSQLQARRFVSSDIVVLLSILAARDERDWGAL